MAPTVPASPIAPSKAEPAGPVAPTTAPAALEPALGVSTSMAISVRTSEQVRAMFDALAADDAKRNRARLSNRHTLDTLVTEAYRRRFGRTR
jgi:hypothetical protein